MTLDGFPLVYPYGLGAASFSIDRTYSSSPIGLASSLCRSKPSQKPFSGRTSTSVGLQSARRFDCLPLAPTCSPQGAISLSLQPAVSSGHAVNPHTGAPLDNPPCRHLPPSVLTDSDSRSAGSWAQARNRSGGKRTRSIHYQHLIYRLHSKSLFLATSTVAHALYLAGYSIRSFCDFHLHAIIGYINIDNYYGVVEG